MKSVNMFSSGDNSCLQLPRERGGNGGSGVHLDHRHGDYFQVFCFHSSLLFHQVVAILCCCCFPCRKKRGRARNLDVNENEKVKEGEEEKGDRLFHQRYEGDGCGR